MRRAAIVAGSLCLSAPLAQAELYYLIVSGLGGETRYDERFAEDARTLESAAKRTVGDESRVLVLQGESADREALRARFADLAESMAESDSLAVFLIGHGSFDGTEYKFNLPGPDIDAAEFATLLEGVPAGSKLIVNASSASGAVLERWNGEDTTLITATRSGAERNATRFGEHFAAALSDDEADLNKNGMITAQEAFDFASRKVADSYELEGTLATEHPQIVGEAAGRFDVARLTARRADTPQLESLTAELESLEGEIAALRARRDEMPAEEYLQTLQDLLVELALVQQRIDAEE